MTSDESTDGTEYHDHYGLVGDCAECGGQMIEAGCLENSEERRATLRCQDCGAEAELRHDFEDGLDGGSWSGVGNPEFKPINWIQCPRCYGHGYVEDPICDLRRAMNGREHPCPNCHTSGKVPRVVETDGGTERKTCINDGCNKPRERVITLYGGVAPVCNEHAEERLENPHAVDQTEFFKGKRDEPKPEPSPNARIQPQDRSVEPDTGRSGGDDA